MSRRKEGGPSELDLDVAYGLEHDIYESDAERAALRAYQHGVVDPVIIEWLRKPVERHRERVALGKEPPFRIPRLRSGKLVLGAASNGAPIRIPVQSLTTGMLVLGNVGASKTSFAAWILSQLASAVAGIWAADMTKADLRRLRPAFKVAGRELVVVGARDLRFNVLQPDGDPRNHLSWVSGVLTRALRVPVRAQQVIAQGLYLLYQKFDVFGTARGGYPTLFDLFLYVKSTSGLNAPARGAILDRLGALLVSLTPQGAAWRRGWRPKDLSREALVFEMRSVSESAKHLVLSCLLFATLYERAERSLSNARISTVCVFEDAQRFLTGSTDSGDVSPIDELGGLLRGLGCGIVVCAQSLQGLSPGLLPNLATKLLGRAGIHADWNRMGQDMGLNPAQLHFAKLHLAPGLFVASCAASAFRHPFLLHTPHYKLSTPVSDQEARESIRALDKLPTEFASEFEHWTPYESVEVSSQALAGDVLPDAELRLLLAIVAEPGFPSSRYPKIARLQVKRAVTARQSLLEQGFVREHTVQSAKRGRPAIVLEPTAEGRKRASELSPHEDDKEAA